MYFKYILVYLFFTIGYIFIFSKNVLILVSVLVSYNKPIWQHPELNGAFLKTFLVVQCYSNKFVVNVVNYIFG